MDQQENTPWQYKPDSGTPPSDLPETGSNRPAAAERRSSGSVNWQAAEYIEHHHSAGWYTGLILITAAIAVAVDLTTKDYFATGTIVVVGIITGIFAGHKPAQVQYDISDAGLRINNRNYPYNSFKSFSILREGPLSSINLYPLKRFMPPISVYFEPADEPKIVGAIGNYLPYEARKLDNIDRLARRLHL
jgi:hypothetical protein